VIEELARRGLDLAAELATADYNAEVDEGLRLPDFGRARARAIVVGNTRALWPEFLASGKRLLDDYVMEAVRAAIGGARAEVRWAHDVPATVAIQRAAAVAGLAYLAPSHLCVHPVYGPWIALRAVIVLDEDGPPRAPAIAPPCDCARGCGPALERALAAGEPRSTEELRERWRLWLAVRDACPVGREHRYGDDQILFHYAGRSPCAEVQE
jgi:methylmalonic aciduria homocystinuria type C protein